MKNNIWLAGIFFLFFLTSCFEDKSNYDFSKLNAPEWEDKGPIELWFRAGETAKFRASPYIKWSGDSVQRASEVTYEWKLGYTVLGNQADFDMPTDEVIKKIGLTQLGGKELSGTFSIIEKATGIAYTKNITVYIDPTNAYGDWIIVSENGGNTKLSLVKRLMTETNELTYELKEDVYPDVNEGEIMGSPLLVTYAEGATNIGAIGALAITTTSGRYEINCENMVKVGNLEEIPFSGKIGARHDAYSRRSLDFGLQTLVTDGDGKMYRRIMTKNNLGGEFGEAPLVLDAKGYSIQKFGQVKKGFNNIPCYDELNQRMVTVLFYSSGDYVEVFPGFGTWNGEEFKLSKLVLTQPADGVEITGCAKVWDMPAGTKALYTWYVEWGGHPFMGGNYDVMGLIYNDAGGKTWLTEFAADYTTGMVRNGANRNIEFPGGNLQEDVFFVTSSNSSFLRNKYILYSKGNQIRFLNRVLEFSDNDFITLPDSDDRVTYMAWAVKSYNELIVCTEKGNVIIYNCAPYSGELKANPKIIKQFNVGGRIVSAKELNNDVLDNDKY